MLEKKQYLPYFKSCSAVESIAKVKSGLPFTREVQMEAKEPSTGDILNRIPALNKVWNLMG